MKAYLVSLESDPDKGNEIIFAKNTKEARVLARKTDLSDWSSEGFLDVKVKRLSEFDGMEKATPKEMMKKQWQEGWWFFQSGCPVSEEPEEEFGIWYRKTFE